MNITGTVPASIFIMMYLNSSNANLLKLFHRICVPSFSTYKVSIRCTKTLNNMIKLCYISFRLIYFITHSPVPTTGQPDLTDSCFFITRSLYFYTFFSIKGTLQYIPLQLNFLSTFSIFHDIVLMLFKK